MIHTMKRKHAGIIGAIAGSVLLPVIGAVLQYLFKFINIIF